MVHYAIVYQETVTCHHTIAEEAVTVEHVLSPAEENTV